MKAFDTIRPIDLIAVEAVAVGASIVDDADVVGGGGLREDVAREMA